MERNTDPERARKRAKSDARCAIKKMGMLDMIEDWANRNAHAEDHELTDLHDEAQQLLAHLAVELDLVR